MFTRSPVAIVPGTIWPDLVPPSMTLGSTPLANILDQDVVNIADFRFVSRHHLLIQIFQQFLTLLVPILKLTESLDHFVHCFGSVGPLAVSKLVARDAFEPEPEFGIVGQHYGELFWVGFHSSVSEPRQGGSNMALDANH